MCRLQQAKQGGVIDRAVSELAAHIAARLDRAIDGGSSAALNGPAGAGGPNCPAGAGVTGGCMTNPLSQSLTAR